MLEDNDDELCEEEDEDDDLEDEYLEYNEPPYEFFKDLTVTKPINGTSYQRERRIVAFGNGDKLMHEEMANFVNQLASFGQKRSQFELQQNQQQQPASFISERRNKKRKDLVQTIIDGPFALNPPTGNTTAGQAAFGSASHSIFNTRTSTGSIIPPTRSE